MLKHPSAQEVIGHRESIFTRHGIPAQVISNNGPQYSSDTFAEFAKEYQFQYLTSTSLYPQGNGEVERAVRTVKERLGEKNPYLALLSYPVTALAVGYSPSELLVS